MATPLITRTVRSGRMMALPIPLSIISQYTVSLDTCKQVSHRPSGKKSKSCHVGLASRGRMLVHELSVGYVSVSTAGGP
jgi:hypothetical protein